MSAQTNLKGLSKFFTGTSAALKKEVVEVFKPRKQEPHLKLVEVDNRPEFIKRREAERMEIRNREIQVQKEIKHREEMKHQEDLMLFVRLVQKNKQK